MAKTSAAAPASGAAPKQPAPKWRRRSLVRVRRPSWATSDQLQRKA
ncbi:MAG TPA: hypothetical protein VFX35_03850 [Solirubrobacterales bacterium]|nr:hypothetical protein [Solirubrobacterales bacterium]